METIKNQIFDDWIIKSIENNGIDSLISRYEKMYNYLKQHIEVEEIGKNSPLTDIQYFLNLFIEKLKEYKISNDLHYKDVETSEISEKKIETLFRRNMFESTDLKLLTQQMEKFAQPVKGKIKSVNFLGFVIVIEDITK